MKQQTFIELFAGAGGMSLGFENAGFKCLAATDYWADSSATYRANFPDTPFIERDIREISTAELLETAGETPDWIIGGPPCQGYSTVGKRNRTDPRNQLFLEFFRIVDDLRPRGFLIENVLGLKDMSFEEEVAAKFESIGYTVEFNVFTAADYGVPQLRRRVIFVGTVDGRSYIKPPPIVSPAEYTSVDAAIGDLPPVGAGETITNYRRTRPCTEYQRIMRAGSTTLQGHTASNHPDHLIEAISHIEDGGNRTQIPAHLQPKSGFHNSYSRLASWKPAVAVTQNMGKPSGSRCIHPRQNRGLTAREGARLQSFPDRFHFEKGVTSQRLQIANAVPPMLAEAIARSLLNPSSWSEKCHDAAENNPSTTFA